LDLSDVFLASSNEHYARDEILKAAFAGAQRRLGERDFSSIVYVGDGIWDARTCRELGIPLIGVASGQQAGQLLDLGAYRVFPDLNDHSSFFQALNELDRRN